MENDLDKVPPTKLRHRFSHETTTQIFVVVARSYSTQPEIGKRGVSSAELFENIHDTLSTFAVTVG